ncbi:uncharacterized protein TRIADDRAFT_51262 [Trichoplax adhaerens]|uniref:Amino acid transporter transmembrane domain-containing protein n=1 Tax=Trichoplax adhaerens TaxID=10228 RepID=B3RI45_TRIAD|nr:hypothetical protein TRIADDRAFT_51262 [Trichoplax adhaerens]EDV28389.1 hypothetical protein TRIADDRAFT_51262 [Trichoplax adhaerens]|eukprot:XP_002107591.1 hypothetical protein TRIADDRAFT_51262 [Trichoplax adhaerens]
MASSLDDFQDDLDFQSNHDDYGHSSKLSRALLYLQIYFVTIATILGTGILGLPVTLSRSGMGPFTVVFIFGFFMQVLLIYFFTILLQKAFAIKNLYGGINDKDLDNESLPLHPVPIASQDNEEENEDFVTGKVIQPLDLSERTYPDLHMMGELFLPCFARQLFDLCTVLLFVSLLISYALAGSEAYAEIIGARHVFVIPFFCWICTLLIIFAQKIIQPMVSILTLAKGGLLIGTVFVTFYVGTQVNQDSHTKWKYIGSPFLMGTVAVGQRIFKFYPAWLINMCNTKYCLRCTDIQGGDLIFNDTNGIIHCNVSLACTIELSVYFLAFGIIFAIAMMDPRGFVTILDKAASLLMNLQAGLFITFMIHRAQTGGYKNLPIPVKMNGYLYYCSYIMTFYFIFAVVYDVVITAVHALK